MYFLIFASCEPFSVRRNIGIRSAVQTPIIIEKCVGMMGTASLTKN